MITKLNIVRGSSVCLITIASLLALPALSDPLPEVNVNNLEKLTWAQATVVGAAENLKLFDANLKSILGFTNLESHLMGCVKGCEKLNSMNPPTRLEYVFPRENPDFLKRFAKAWETTQAETKDPGLSITFDVGEIPDCSGAANPAPCQSVPFCAIDQCGRKTNRTIDCNAC